MLVNVWVFHTNGSRASTLLLPVRFVGDRSGSSRLCRGLRFDQRRQCFLKGLRRLRQYHAILRALRPGERWFNRREIEREQLGVFSFRSLVVMKESLLAAVGFDEGNLLGTAPGELQVFQGLFINRKNSAGRAVLRRHVRDSRAIGERQVAQPGTEVLDKLSDDPMLAQHLGDGENKISSSRPLPQSPRQLYSHN